MKATEEFFNILKEEIKNRIQLQDSSCNIRDNKTVINNLKARIRLLNNQIESKKITEKELILQKRILQAKEKFIEKIFLYKISYDEYIKYKSDVEIFLRFEKNKDRVTREDVISIMKTFSVTKFPEPYYELILLDLVNYYPENHPEEKQKLHDTLLNDKKYEFIIDTRKQKKIIKKICDYQKGKSKPKDLARPIRAAIDAGIISRPTYNQYKSVRPFAKITKTSFHDYTDPAKKPYDGDKSFNAMVNSFKEL